MFQKYFDLVSNWSTMILSGPVARPRTMLVPPQYLIQLSDTPPCPSASLWLCQKSDRAGWPFSEKCCALRCQQSDLVLHFGWEASGEVLSLLQVRCLASWSKVVWPSEHLSRAYNGPSSYIPAHLCVWRNNQCCHVLWDLGEDKRQTKQGRSAFNGDKPTQAAERQRMYQGHVFCQSGDNERDLLSIYDPLILCGKHKVWTQEKPHSDLRKGGKTSAGMQHEQRRRQQAGRLKGK